MMKRIRSVVIAFVLVMMSSLPVLAAGSERVFDDAQLFSESEMIEVQKNIEVLQAQINMDIVIVTSDEVPSGETVPFADTYYDNGGYGIGDNQSGALFLIDMANQEMFISTTGDMITALPEVVIDEILDEVYQDLSAGNYGIAANTFLFELQNKIEIEENVVDNSIGAQTEEQVDTQTDAKTDIQAGVQTDSQAEVQEVLRDVRSNVPKSPALVIGVILIACVGAAITALIPCLIIKNKYKGGGKKAQEKKYRLAYQAKAKFNYDMADDHLINEYTHQKHIPRETRTNERPTRGYQSNSGSLDRTSSRASSTTKAAATKSPPKGTSSSRSFAEKPSNKSSSDRTHGGGGRKF